MSIPVENLHAMWWIPLITSFLAIPAHTQSGGASLIGAPLVGLMTNAEKTEVRPIQGVPGSSTVGAPIALPAGVSRVYLAPGQKWALVETTGGLLAARSLGLLIFSGARASAVMPIGIPLSEPDILSFSPTGRSAVLVSVTLRRLQVIAGLDKAPQLAPMVASEIDISGLGGIDAAAVSDDGTLSVVLGGGGRVWLLESGQPPQLIFQVGSPAGVSFLSGQASVAIFDGAAARLTVIGGLNGVPSTLTAISGPAFSGGVVFVQSSADGKSVFVAEKGDTAAYQLEIASGALRSLQVPVSLARFDQMGSADSFLFSANPGQAAWLLLADGANLSAGFSQPAGRSSEPARSAAGGGPR